MLKSSAVLLSLMILLMGEVPCADYDQCQEGTQIQQNFEANGHPDAHHLDLCTPFCTCHCCHTHVTQIDRLGLSDFGHFKNELPMTSYLLVEGIAIPILDPPRLAS